MKKPPLSRQSAKQDTTTNLVVMPSLLRQPNQQETFVVISQHQLGLSGKTHRTHMHGRRREPCGLEHFLTVGVDF